MFVSSCSNCNATLISAAVKDGDLKFCSKKCHEHYKIPDFCDDCISSTTDKSSGNLYRLNGIGTTLIGFMDECPKCKSILKTYWFTFLFIPLIPLAKYRLKYVTKDSFITRKVVKK